MNLKEIYSSKDPFDAIPKQIMLIEDFRYYLILDSINAKDLAGDNNLEIIIEYLQEFPFLIKEVNVDKCSTGLKNYINLTNL